jgi:hypothetical protein
VSTPLIYDQPMTASERQARYMARLRGNKAPPPSPLASVRDAWQRASDEERRQILVYVIGKIPASLLSGSVTDTSNIVRDGATDASEGVTDDITDDSPSVADALSVTPYDASPVTDIRPEKTGFAAKYGKKSDPDPADIAAVLAAFLGDRRHWQGGSHDLRAGLAGSSEPIPKWLGRTQDMSGVLFRAIPALANLGIAVRRWHTGAYVGGTGWQITRVVG